MDGTCRRRRGRSSGAGVMVACPSGNLARATPDCLVPQGATPAALPRYTAEMIIAIPDDYHERVSRLDCLTRLPGHDVRIFHDVAPPADRLLANLRDAEVIVPVRERTRFTRELIERLPRLRLFSQTGRSTHHIDVAACAERGIAIAT